MTDNDKRTIFGFPVASIEFVDKGRDAELARLRAALARAERDVSGLRNDRDMWRDAAYEAADVSEELDRSRRTIRALVVAARAMHGIGELDGYRDGWIGLVRELVREIKADSIRGQAGKE